MTTRAVSNPVGIVLILGMTVLSVGALLAVGGAAVNDARADAERSQMENSMSAFSSKASLVGLGESGHQRFSMGRVIQGQVDVREDAGNVRIWVERPDCEEPFDDDCEIANTSMGAVVYENDGREIAYQGGGIWARQGDFSRMLSPPEFHYRAETLTFPIINVTGSGAASGDIRGSIQSEGESRQLYPRASDDADEGGDDDDNDALTNPLTNETVYVEIESEYCRGWESFIQERSQGGLNKTCEQGSSNTLVVDLDVDVDPTFGAAVTTGDYQSGGNVTVTSDGEGTDIREGTTPTSATRTIENEVNDCLENDCSSFSDSDSLGSGKYYTEDLADFNDLEFTGNAETVVVLNDTDDEGLVDVGEIDITGDGNVTVYLYTDEGFEMIGQGKDKNNINSGGDPTKFRMYVSSGGTCPGTYVNFNGGTEYTGALYAPCSIMEGGQGGVEVTGAVVVNEFDIRGNSVFTFDQRMETIDPQIEADTIKYLHISENSISIDF